MVKRNIEICAKDDSPAVRIFAANEHMNQLLIESLDPGAWTAKLATKAWGRAASHTRTIAAIFTHMHNVRAKWVRLTAPHLKVPTRLDRAHCTPQQARAGLTESAARCEEMLAESFDDGGGKETRVKTFVRDGWAKPWPVGPEMLCYMIAHEAHHRGQICLLAGLLGFPLASEAKNGIWNWEKIWRECGAPIGPGHDS